MVDTWSHAGITVTVNTVLIQNACPPGLGGEPLVGGYPGSILTINTVLTKYSNPPGLGGENMAVRR